MFRILVIYSYFTTRKTCQVTFSREVGKDVVTLHANNSEHEHTTWLQYWSFCLNAVKVRVGAVVCWRRSKLDMPYKGDVCSWTVYCIQTPGWRREGFRNDAGVRVSMGIPHAAPLVVRSRTFVWPATRQPRKRWDFPENEIHVWFAVATAVTKKNVEMWRNIIWQEV
jgi:hypothetical protein